MSTGPYQSESPIHRHLRHLQVAVISQQRIDIDVQTGRVGLADVSEIIGRTAYDAAEIARHTRAAQELGVRDSVIQAILRGR